MTERERRETLPGTNYEGFLAEITAWIAKHPEHNTSSRSATLQAWIEATD